MGLNQNFMSRTLVRQQLSWNREQSCNWMNCSQ